MTNKQTRIAELEDEIRRHRRLYYNDQPDISDEAYDALEDELRQLDPDHPLLEDVGAEPPEGGWSKKQHRFFLGSLGKARNEDELYEWAERVRGSLSGKPETFSWSEKLDGISLALNYTDGTLQSAVTRGDGTEGENILPNAVLFQGVLRESRSNFTGTVRGEVVLPLDAYRKHLSSYSNPRNAAAGIARVEDRKEASRLCPHLKFFAYDVLSNDPGFETEKQKFLILQDQGFKVPNHGIDLTPDEIVELHEQYQRETRQGLHYEIDGIVVRVPKLGQYRRAGEFNNRPLGAVAFKFPNEGAVTTLRDVSWDVGNTGRVTPVAHFDAVEISGASIENASLYNASYIDELGLCIGDNIYVERAGEVIPRVEEKVAETGDVAVHPPNNCPACDTSLEWEGEYLVCSNTEGCPTQTLGDLKRWVESLNILEWGEFLLSEICEQDLASSPPELYELTVGDLADLRTDNDARFGEDRARKAIGELDRSPTLTEFLGGLNIKSLRKRTAEKLIDAASPGNATEKLSEIRQWSEQDLRRIDGIGPKTAAIIEEGLETKSETIEHLLGAGIEPELPGGPLEDLTFCITGRLSKTRSEVESDIEATGGKMTGVTKDLDYLVTNNPDSTSNKAQKARRYDIPFVSEQRLYEMMEA